MPRDRFQPPLVKASRIIDAVITPADEPLSIDELIGATLDECEKLPSRFIPFTHQIRELHSRLAHGRLHLAVVGEFNRGKSTFINGLIGMQLLPTSVLPITAVPTRIIYGPDLSCTVRFLNKKPDILVHTSQENITKVLLQYVAEENNPKNRYGVDSVEVTVPSPLLENGTMLIDTPGFGSTYLHNTKTALDALTDCDAALFLLSADPPMTQTEVEFLKQVVKHVPRLFFILNKVDLLTSQQREQVDGFISDILIIHLHQPEKPRLFHICARQAENARRQSPSDPQWTSSGMEAIRSDILAFMAREKYFTLSQALNDKLNEAISNIIVLLQKEKNDFEAPVIILNRERDALARERTSIGNAMEKELSLIPAEKTAMMKFLDEQLAAGKPKLSRQIRDAMKILLDSSTCDAPSLKGLTAALNTIIPEAFTAFKTQLLARLNRPLKKALVLHGKEFGTIVQSMHSCISGIGELPENRLQEKLDALEIDPDESSASRDGTAALTIALQWNDRFFSRRNRIQRLHERYDPRCDELLQGYFSTFLKRMRRRIDTLFSSLDELLTAEYRRLSDQLERIMKHKEESIAGSIERNNRAATELTTRLEAFQRIAGRLH
ncbi:MAG: dynamin family protein [Chitinispirillaceae bacterium]|nr:dynamin family protein [Chitinispirillaceae bacterium]